ncbi:Matrix metalloproteinase-24-like [Homarus americanus]|uniref:Matrix metalloproteinase-24-like n=1 Tax=Homarus americanus TaxID=6706 RepID=A0A8J5JLG5_HOMAM|nr:Matrix metalloproteinase-24-like [Homarus americanus]
MKMMNKLGSDGYIFDGPGRVLAHAFYPGPRIGGDLHFDDSENFVAHHLREKYKGKSLLITAAHELGHSLGLRHSDVENALMAPYYQDFPEDLKLPFDDKYGIQTLYGRPQSHYTTATLRPPTTPYITPFLPRTTPYKPQTLPPVTLPTNPHFPPTKPTTTPTTKPTTTPATKPTTTPTTKPTTTPTKPIKPSDDVPCPAGDPPQDGPPDTCDTDFDAVIKFHGEFYFFKDGYYWRISRKGYMYKNESPNRIWNRFPGLPTSMRRVDAVYVSRENTLIFFGGSSYYELGRSLRLKTTGKLTDLGVNVSYLDTAMVWGHNGRIYLFSGDHYWRLGTDGRAEPDYPRDVTVWRGLPRNYSAAFTVRSSTYFLSGHVFWSFDSLKMRISEPPSLIAPYWFSCPYYKQNKLRHCFPSSAPMTHPNHLLHLYIWIAILCLTSL